MSRAAFDTVVGIVAADASRFLDRFHTLTVHDGRAEIRVAARSLPFGVMQRRVEQMPPASEAETTEMIEHRLPGRKVARQVSPRTAGTHNIEDGVKDAA